MSKKKSAKPELIAIEHDDYAAKYVGHTPDGGQFFLTTPFEGERKDNPGCEYIALYRFDREGNLVDAIIDSLGPRKSVDKESARALIRERLSGLGTLKFGCVWIKPFSIKKFDREFGLIAQPPSDGVDSWAVTAEPGNYMAFFEPWDSGEYDT